MTGGKNGEKRVNQPEEGTLSMKVHRGGDAKGVFKDVTTWGGVRRVPCRGRGNGETSQHYLRLEDRRQEGTGGGEGRK